MSTAVRLAVFAAALAVATPAHAATAPKPDVVPAPTGLKAFVLRADEPPATDFARTPSLAWSPVSGADAYEVRLSTTATFREGTVIWTGRVAKTPAISIPVALPWMTGTPNSYYVQARAVPKKGAPSVWSTALGFNMRAPKAPLSVQAAPGLIRWTPVEGATAYQVRFFLPAQPTTPELHKTITTLTNYADQRELYTFHQLFPWPSYVRWRVRAMRSMYGEIPSKLPAAAFGPWSDVNVTYNPPMSLLGAITTVGTASDGLANGIDTPHAQTPAFLFNGSRSLFDTSAQLYRVYVATDRDCVNIVYTGAVVGSPAYAPRVSGTLALPQGLDAIAKAQKGYLLDGPEGATMFADGTPTKATETVASRPGASTLANGPAFNLPAAEGPLVGLWDTWPESSYYWTAVAVELVRKAGEENTYVWADAELPQDACAAGRVLTFGKLSQPVVAGHLAPFVSGLSVDGRLVTAAVENPKFYGSPIAAWNPAPGALAYEVQLSRSLSPWKAVGPSAFTYGTSTVLQDAAGKPLAAGTWYYRVRGLDPYLPGPSKDMSWSEPVRLEIAKPVYRVVGKGEKPGTKGTTPPAKKKPATAKTSFRRVGVAGTPASLGVPTSWRTIDRKGVAAARKNDELKHLGPGLADLERGRLKLLAFDAADPRTVLAVSASRHAFASRSAWVKKTMNEARHAPGIVGLARCNEVVLPAGVTVRCSWREKGQAVVRYSFWRHDAAYHLLFVSLLADADAREDVFAAVASRVRIPAAKK